MKLNIKQYHEDLSGVLEPENYEPNLPLPTCSHKVITKAMNENDVMHLEKLRLEHQNDKVYKLKLNHRETRSSVINIYYKNIKQSHILSRFVLFHVTYNT